jgi:hypothetical protein
MNTASHDAVEKPGVAEMERGGRQDGILQDAPVPSGQQDIALGASSLPQFAHLNEKKILRKVGSLSYR